MTIPITLNPKEGSMKIERRKFLLGMAAAGGALVAGCAGKQTRPTLRGYSVPAIDLHAHWHAPEFVALIAKEGGNNGGKVSTNERGQVVLSVPGIGTVFQQQYIDLEIRLKAMNAAGVDVHALSETSPMVYWAPPPFALRLSQIWNDSAAAAHLRYPDRFLGLSMVPMHDTNLALQELDRAANLPGIRGMYMATHVNGKNLDDKAFWPVYARCETLGLPIFLHPIHPGGADRMRSYYLRNFIGNPTDTAIAAASLVFGGVLDAFPRLDVVLPHAGGTLPILIGRWDHGATVRPEVKELKNPPSTLLRRFHYDTIAHSAPILMNLVGQVGVDRVVCGTDFPADMSDVDPVRTVESLTELSTSDRDKILRGN